MIRIRSALVEDREGLIQLVYRQKNFNEQEYVVAIEVIDEMLGGKSDYSILVAVDEDSQVGGYICFGPIPMTEKRYDLYWIAVDPSIRRMGLGALLLKGMEDDLREKGRGHVYIDTSSTTGYFAAHAFYENNGYQVACVLGGFYRDGDDKIIYMKEL